MNDLGELLGLLILIGLMITAAVFFVAALFAAPGYLVLLLIDHDPIGFWNSAAAGLGSIVIGGLGIAGLSAMRGK